MNINFNIEFRESWKNDTKWRKPDLSKLKNYVSHNNFVSLREGIIKMLSDTNNNKF